MVVQSIEGQAQAREQTSIARPPTAGRAWEQVLAGMWTAGQAQALEQVSIGPLNGDHEQVLVGPLSG